MKRVLAFVLMLTLILTMLPVNASAEAGDKLIAITFDDGPDSKDTPRLLDGLKARGVPVTFFVMGENLEWGSRYVSRAYAEGHEIGCHSWDHPDLNGLSPEEVQSQFDRSYLLMDEICGEGSEYLIRPPYGNTTEEIREMIGAPLILWSVDTLDWELLDEYAVRDAILRDAYDGAIVLLHDIHGTSVDGALMAIDVLLARGYELVTVSELFRRRGVALEDGERYYDCKPTGTDLGPIPTPEITYTTDKVTMNITIAADTDAPIYYTTDGTAPTPDSPVYTGPFTVDYPCDIRAVAACKLNGNRSKTAVLAFGQTPCAPPTMEMDGMNLVLSHEIENIDIHYTLDGSRPTFDSPLYTGPVEVEGDHQIRAAAGGGFYAMSGEISLYCSGNGNLFADVAPAKWYYRPIDNLVTRGLMSGMGDYRFAPNTRLTRGMLVTLLYRFSGDDLGENWEKTSGFADVDQSKYYARSVEWAYRNGIVSGYSPRIFRPDGDITRQELCAVIDGYLRYKGIALERGSSCRAVFRDYDRISSWAVSSVEALVNAGMIAGDGAKMDPHGSATRAEVATVLNRVLDYEESKMPQPEPTEPPAGTPAETTAPPEVTAAPSAPAATE